MPDADRDAFIAEPHVAVLATVDGRGRPHAAPIWYLYEDGAFLVSTGRGGQKHRNAERRPEAMLVLDRREVPYRALMIRCRVEIAPALTADQRRALAVRYLGEESGRRYAERLADGESVTLRLVPEHTIEYGGRAARDG